MASIGKNIGRIKILVIHFTINMGQQEVYTFLKKNRNRWFMSKDIANNLAASLGSVTTCLKKLRDSSSVSFKYPNKKGQGKNSYIYKFKE